MAKTGDIYTAVEELKGTAAIAFGNLEVDDDLDQLITDLGEIRDKADRVQTVAIHVREALKDLASK